VSSATPRQADEKIGRALFHLAWPLALSGQLDTLNDTITTFWVGRLGGTVGLAVLGILRPIVLTLAWLLDTVPAGARSIIARHVGAKSGRAGAIVKHAMFTQALVASPLAIAGVVIAAPLAGILAGHLREQEHVLRWYLVPWALNLPIYALVRVVVSSILATGWTRLGLWRVLLSLCLEAATIPLFMHVFGLGMLGVPIAELITDAIFLALVLLLLLRTADRLGLSGWRGAGPALEPGQARKFFAIGGPGQLARVVMFLVILTLTRRLLSGGGQSLAALALALQILFFMAGVTLSLAGATGILIGQSVGGGRRERAVAAIKLSATSCVAIGATLCVVTPWLDPVVGLFTPDAEVVSRTMKILTLAHWGILFTGLWQLLASCYTALGRSGWAGLAMAIADCTGGVIALFVADPLDAVAWWFIASNVLKLTLLAGLIRPILVPQLRAA